MLFSIYESVWSLGRSHLDAFLHIMEMSFGSNIAYAILIRSGELQGVRLLRYAEQQHLHAQAAHDALAAEYPDLMKQITIDGNKTRCANFITETRKRMVKLIPRFSAVAATMAFVSVILVLIAGIDQDAYISNVVAVLGTMVLFAPVPIGLVWTYVIVKHAEDNVKDEYRKFYDLPAQFTTTPSAQIVTSLDAIKAEMSVKNPGVLKRFFSSTAWN